MGALMDRARLAAYVDGALEPEEAASVVMHLADDAEDRYHVEQLTEQNAMLIAAYAAPLAQPVPEQIRRILEPSTAEASRVVPFRRRSVWPAAAIALAGAAAGIVVVAGIFGSGEQLLPAGAPGVGPVAVGSELHAALEMSPSGMEVGFPDGDEVTLIATFRDGAGQPCREFELRHDTGTAFSRGIACRAPDDAWAIAVTVTEPSVTGGGTDQGYVPASGTVDAALSSALDVLGAGLSLTPAAEQTLIASGWALPECGNGSSRESC